MIKTPEVFMPICHELLINPKVFEDAGISLAAFALAKIESKNVPELLSFIDGLLSETYSDQDLKAWWDRLPVGFYFLEAVGVRRLLEALRSELQRPGFLDGRD